MEIDELIEALGYLGNPNFVEGAALASAADYAHVFRRGVERVKLRGVYSLRQPCIDKSKSESLIPTVYVCAANDEQEARSFQKLVWNQNIAPFLLIHTPTRVRLFSGFAFADGKTKSQKHSKKAMPLDLGIEFSEIEHALAAFEAEAVDDGTIWREFGKFVVPQQRVDWDLLTNLEALDAKLIASGLDWKVSHALIGKYVYLSYLRQRNILSPHRLAEAEVQHEQVFSRRATRTSLKKLLDYIDAWLNGSVYPLEWTRQTAPRQEHVQLVAGTFAGDTPDGQLHLPFDRYDFSVIPVETLSSIYEFFLHANDPKNKKRSAAKLGAYYTPVPLVNFMLDELDRRVPLKNETKCFDASCGSGAFLVQSYRRMIERRVRADGKQYRRPRELRDLLTQNVFGVDRDGDACRVTELSLILTLLDYVDPPDLAPLHNFKLPDLHNKNIFEGDFFKRESAFSEAAKELWFDWIVGNPPWIELRGKNATDEDRDAREWVDANTEAQPIGGHQLAEAFLWKVTDHLSKTGGAAMLVPAMTLFKDESTDFRQRFFTENQVWTVANFANMAEVLFAGRSRVPAAAIFYSKASGSRDADDVPTVLYSPLVANQDANRPDSIGQQKDTWSITITDSETREIPAAAARSGDRFPWKTAMWGSRLDQRLLETVSKRFDAFGAVCSRIGLLVHAGLELRLSDGSKTVSDPLGGEPIEPHSELVGQLMLDTKPLRGKGRVYSFPESALFPIPAAQAFVRAGRGILPVQVSEPPHVIVNATRRYAVYSDRFIAVPPRQIGIAGPRASADLLKAVALYLSSDFTVYQQFLASPQWGIHVSVATLDVLKTIPFPYERLISAGLREWADLHAALVEASSVQPKHPANQEAELFENESERSKLSLLEAELNDRVAAVLGLRERERWLVADLVHVKMKLLQGKVDAFATHAPTSTEFADYAGVLKHELDAFIAVATDERHAVDIVRDNHGSMIRISRGAPLSPTNSVRVHRADSSTARPLMAIRERLLKKHSQWLYFERALRVYKPDATYLFKPMQYFHWLKSQALVDAAEIIADRAATGEK